MSFLPVYITVALVILSFMAIIWIVSLVLRNSSIVDIFWGTGFVFTNWIYFALSPDGFPGRQWLINIMITVWGLRLSFYILWRNWGKEEDFRYKKWREKEGPKWGWISLFKVFWIQGILLWIISTPLLSAQISPSPERLTIFDIAAVLFWSVGFFCEAVGDWQLARFKSNPKNKNQVLRSGIWRYTRHPNYFGDALQWWAFYLMAVAAGGSWTIFSPLIMTILLLRISGVALIEKSLVERRPGYLEYIKTTSAFIPWFPRKKPRD